MASTKRFYRRRFLNRRGHHAGAYVIADVDVETFESSAVQRTQVTAFLTVADCGRIATLDFDVQDAKAAGNALHKARLLRDVVDGLTDALRSSHRQGPRSRPVEPRGTGALPDRLLRFVVEGLVDVHVLAGWPGSTPRCWRLLFGSRWKSAIVLTRSSKSMLPSRR